MEGIQGNHPKRVPVTATCAQPGLAHRSRPIADIAFLLQQPYSRVALSRDGQISEHERVFAPL